MRKKLPKILIIFFAVVFILQITALLFLLINPAAAIEFTPQVGIGNDFQAGSAVTVGGDTVAKYIKAIYQYGIGVVGILSAVVLMFGGLLWLTAGGNTGQVTEAKEWIKASLTGLIIALFSYIILLTINPDLVQFKTLNITPIQKTSEEIVSACGGLGQAWGYYTNESDCAACGGVDACEIQTANDVQCYKCKFTSCPAGYQDLGEEMTQQQAQSACESTSGGAATASLYNIDGHGCIKCLCRGTQDPKLACGQEGSCTPTRGAGSRISTIGTLCPDPNYPLCNVERRACYARTINTWPPDPNVVGIYTNQVENINSQEECNNQYSSILVNLQNYSTSNPNARLDVNISWDSNTKVCSARIVVQ